MSLRPRALPAGFIAPAHAPAFDGEAVSCGPDGIASFDRIRYRRHDGDVFMWAFDLIEFNGDDLRRTPLAVRKVDPRTNARECRAGVTV